LIEISAGERRKETQEDIRKNLLSSIENVEKWVENHRYKAYEPFDGLSSFLKPLTFDNRFAERILQQVVRRIPLNIRPLIGVKPFESTKGRGYMAWGYLTMFRHAREERHRQNAVEMLGWLDKNKSPNYVSHSWGNHFIFSSRNVRTPIYEPIIVWTSLIGQVFLDAYALSERPKYLEIAKSVCDWIMSVPREVTERGVCLSYVAYDQTSIHNSNMLGAAMLAKTGALCGSEEYLRVARLAMEYSCSRQREDGSWFYGESPNCHWIDNFHTGYNLDSLKCYIDSTGDGEFRDNLAKGFAFYIRSFFKPDGTPKYYHDRTYPIDIQCASQSIDTLATFSGHDPSALDMAIKVARWTIENMQDRDGHFYYVKMPFWTDKTPMLHWGQATMYKALANLLTRL
jgi:rhamnogalacturonyl hydrolase YesR